MKFLSFALILSMAISVGCIKDTNEHLSNMDHNTAAMDKRMELLTKEMELMNLQIKALTEHTGTLAEVALKLAALQEYVVILTMEIKNISASLAPVGDLANLAKQLMSHMIADAFSGDEPPPPTDDLDDILNNPQPTPTPTPLN